MEPLGDDVAGLFSANLRAEPPHLVAVKAEQVLASGDDPLVRKPAGWLGNPNAILALRSGEWAAGLSYRLACVPPTDGSQFRRSSTCHLCPR